MTMTSKEHIISKTDLESQAELKGTGGGIGDGRKRPNTQMKETEEKGKAAKRPPPTRGSSDYGSTDLALQEEQSAKALLEKKRRQVQLRRAVSDNPDEQYTAPEAYGYDPATKKLLDDYILTTGPFDPSKTQTTLLSQQEMQRMAQKPIEMLEQVQKEIRFCS